MRYLDRKPFPRKLLPFRAVGPCEMRLKPSASPEPKPAALGIEDLGFRAVISGLIKFIITNANGPQNPRA